MDTTRRICFVIFAYMVRFRMCVCDEWWPSELIDFFVGCCFIPKHAMQRMKG